MKIYHSLAFATALLAVGCANNEDVVTPDPVIPDSQKEMISFSLSDNSAQTRAGFTGADTRIVMRIQSDKKEGTGTVYTRTVAQATKDTEGGETDFSLVSFDGNDKRYWDDAHGRYSLLSVYAVAIPNTTNTTILSADKLNPGTSSSETGNWGTNSDNTIQWSVTTTAQKKGTEGTVEENIDKEDLVYSNNIQVGGKDGVYRWNGTTWDPANTGAKTHHNGQMLFFQDGMTDETVLTTTITDAPGHFDKGHLVFKHALSRMTITLQEGTGFDKTSANKDNDFKFTNGENITLVGLPTSGKLNVKTGEWTDKVTNVNINSISSSKTTTAADATFAGQMLPDYEFADNSNTNVMQFTIDNNTYYITQDMIFEALKDKTGVTVSSGKIKMEQGKNYVFTITVNKTGIDAVTATLVPWDYVNAEEFEIDNSHITVSTLKITDGTACREFNLYRLGEDLGAIYTDDSYLTEDGKALGFSGNYLTEGVATKTETSTNSNIWDTNWFFENNRTAYHFRTVNDLANTNVANNTSTQTVFTMVSGAQTQDYHWGAPMITTADLKYDPATGFAPNIHRGINSAVNNTTKTINITELHMMSNINIILTTPTGGEGVDLSDAEVTITRFSKEGTVDMGTGFITPSTASGKIGSLVLTTPTSYWKTATTTTNAFTGAIVPQSLVRNGGAAGNDDYVGITIKTSDNNQYYIIERLSTITAKTVTNTRNQEENAYITTWYPGHNYTYTIKIKKTGIDAITCTVAAWVNVEADEIEVDLEK
ncbi:MAG: fimbrillin family protein [Bacteroidales bacterium]|nr:fimbrillin family protein [Bacteroidales bacterium]